MEENSIKTTKGIQYRFWVYLLFAMLMFFLGHYIGEYRSGVKRDIAEYKLILSLYVEQQKKYGANDAEEMLEYLSGRCSSEHVYRSVRDHVKMLKNAIKPDDTHEAGL